MSWTVPDTRAARPTGSEPKDGVPAAAVRAAVFTAVGTGLAVTGHHLVSGHSVPWRAVLLAATLLYLLTVPAARRVRSLPVVVAATGAVQGALHLWFVRTGGHLHASPDQHAAHHTTGAHEAWHAQPHNGAAMTAVHIAAALLAAWCMQRADTACLAVGYRLGHLLTHLLLRLVPPGRRPDSDRTPPAAPTPRPSHLATSILLAHSVVRRGPPATI